MAAVDIHIVTHNNEDTIEPTIKSALSQIDVDASIRVIDNASTDNTVKVVEKLPVKLIRNDTNTGYSAAHNQGIALSTAPYICTLNPDVVLQTDYLAKAVAILEAHPQLGSIAGCLYMVNKLGDSPTLMDSIGLTMSRSRRQRLQYHQQPITAYDEVAVPVFGPDGAAAVYRRTMLDDIAIDGEIFDEDFFMHKEDIDVCWRAQLYGWQSLHVPDARATHIRTFRPGQRDGITPFLRFLGVRNRYLLMLKNERLQDLARDLPYILSYDVGIVGYVLLRERSSISAFISAVRLTPKMLAKRRKIQARARREMVNIRQWLT